MVHVIDVFLERGFLKQITHERAVRDIMGVPHASCYVGLDPTADSLHVGSLLPIMALMHLERCGNRPICILGGATALVGDPSGKTEMRKMLSRDQIEENARKIRAQLSRYLDLDGGDTLLLNNADWLGHLRYIDFLRDIGRHFSVNRMLSAESYKLRLQSGLSFIEFNYQLLQAYDFLYLYREHDCRVQMGGDDQWGNIVAGADLIRRVEGGDAQGLTWPLLQTSSGEKMGKTAQGAIWLDPTRTSPYDFFQYWINVDDADVERFLCLFTFLSMEEVKDLCAEGGSALKRAKERLALETTKISHGEKAAQEAYGAARALFGEGDASGEGVPSSDCSVAMLDQGWLLLDAMVETALVSSKGAARRLIQGGGAYVNGEKVVDELRKLTRKDLRDGYILLRSGKKAYHRLKVL